MKEILPLTSLRFFAAFYVFIFHIHIRWPLTSNRFLNNFLLEGGVGMSLFFILSGFILYNRYYKIEFTAHHTKNYIIHRFSRIYPIYFLAAICSMRWLGIHLEGNNDAAILLYIGRLSFIIITNIFLLQAWIPQLFDYWNNGGSWSISVEAFFYTLFPFIQKLVNKLPIKKILAIGFISYIFTTIVGFSMFLFPKDYAMRVAYSVPLFRLPEFIIGIVTAVISIRYHNNKINYNLIFWVLMVGAIIYLGIFGNSNSGYICHNFIIVPLIALMVLCAAKFNSGLSYKIFSLKPLIILGHASYSFYSFQILIILYIAPKYKEVTQNTYFWNKNSVFLLVIFSCLIIMSLLSYYIIEEPFRKFINNKFHTKKD